LSLATEDFNEDGWPDLAAGYATGDGDGVAVLYFGDRDAYAPEKPETLAGIAQNRFPLPFLSEARAFTLPEAPDFLAAGDFNRGGNPGLLVGARGSQQLYILAGDGHGGLGTPQAVVLPGKLTALAAGHIGREDSWPDVAVGVVGSNGPALLIYKGGLGGLFAPPVVYALDDEATRLKIGNLDDDAYGDVAILAGGSLSILHGQLWGPGSATGVPRSAVPEMESVPAASGATAFAIGNFIWERNNRMEIAVLAGSGVQILSRGTPDKRPLTVAQIRAARQAMAQLRLARLKSGTPPPVPRAWQPGATQPWQVAQSINIGAAASASDLEAVTTALPDRAPQSVLLVGASSQLHLLTEPPGPTNANPTYGSENSTSSTSGAAPQVAASWSDDVETTGGATAAILPMRVNVSAQPGLVTLHQGQVAPMVMISAGGASYSVNRTDDPTPGALGSICNGVANDCSLREAIIKANSTSNATVNIPTGTYTLTIGEDDDPNADPTKGDLDINASMTITGAGAGSTIISANFPTTDGQDGKIFGVNQLGNEDGIQVSISGVTLEGARNSVGNNDPTFAQTGGAIDFFLTGTGVNYTLSSCIIKNNTNVHSYGGGIDIDSGADFNGNFGGQNHGTVTISNCTIIGNTTQAVNSTASSGANCAGLCAGADAVGGGIRLGADIHNVVITNSIISDNHTCAGSSPTGPYEGGGIWILHTNGGTISIHSTAIGDSVNGGNQSASRGGGISMGAGVATTTLTIDQGSAIQDNVSGTLSSGTAEGGGIYIAGLVSTSLNQVTITGNSLSSITTDHRGGGGIAVGDVTSPVTVSFSRIAGNSASSSTGTGLHKDSQSGTVTATDDWWGCNAGPGASPCDTAVIVAGSGSLNFNPWLKLALSPSTSQSVENNNTLFFTADLNHDSNGSSTADNIPDGTPISFGATGGIGSDSPTGTTTSGGTAGSTFTASALGSGTVTTTVDGQVVSTPVTVYIPVTIASSPSGKSFVVTGGTACVAGAYTTPQTLDWSAAFCTVQFTSPVSNGTGAQLAFSDWADDGDTNNPRTITTPSAAAIFTANFVQQYQVTTAVSPATGGSVTTPASGTYLTSGAAATLSATTNPGYTFTNWSVTSGAATFGNANAASTTVTLSSGPATVQANFNVGVTVATSPGGLSFTIDSTSYPSGTTVFVTPGVVHQLGLPTPQSGGAGTQYVFTQWSSGATTNPISILVSLPTSYTADFTTQYQLTTAVTPAGDGTVTTPASGTFLNSGAAVSLSAAANTGYTFHSWSATAGAATFGNANSSSTTVTLSTGPATVTADFQATNFGNINICLGGQTTPAPCSQTVTLSYGVNNDTTFGAINVLTQGAPNLDFTLSSTTCTGTITAGNSCTVGVKFAPLAPGLRMGAVQLLDSSSNLLATIFVQGDGQGPAMAFGPGVQTTVGSGLSGPWGVAVDGAGDVFIADSNNSRVVEVPAGGGAQTTVGSGLSKPTGVAVDGAGDVFIADNGLNQVVEVPAGGGAQTTVGSGLSSPYGVAVDGAGDVFIADIGLNQVVEVPAGGGVQTTVASGLNSPYGVAVDGAGDVFIANAGANQVVEVPAGGGAQTTVGTGLSSPSGVAVDGAGNVFIADNGNSRVVEVPTGGGAQTTVGSGLSGPTGMAVDGVGDVFISDVGLSQVAEVQRSKAPTLSFATTLEGNTSTDSPQSVTVQNIGNQPLDAVSPGLSIGAASFVQVAGSGVPPDCTSSFALAPGASCNLSLSFAPQTTGNILSAATFTDNALNATSASQSITLQGSALTPPTVTFTGAPANAPYLGTFTVTSTTNSSSPPVYTSNGSCTNVGTLYTMTSGSGACYAIVTWVADSNYTSAKLIQRTTASKIAPTVTFTGAPASQAYQGTFTVASTTNSSRSPVYTSSGSCSNAGALYTMTKGTGTCTAKVSWVTDANYLRASLTQTTTASKGAQTITFTTPAPATAANHSTFPVAAESTSGLTVAFSVDAGSTGVCKVGTRMTVGAVSSVTVTMLRNTGACTIDANQGGNNNYAAAAQQQTSAAAQ